MSKEEKIWLLLSFPVSVHFTFTNCVYRINKLRFPCCPNIFDSPIMVQRLKYRYHFFCKIMTKL